MDLINSDNSWKASICVFNRARPELRPALISGGKALTEVLMSVLFTVVLLSSSSSSSLLAPCSRSLFSVSARAFSLTAESGEFRSCSKLAKKIQKKRKKNYIYIYTHDFKFGGTKSSGGTSFALKALLTRPAFTIKSQNNLGWKRPQTPPIPRGRDTSHRPGMLQAHPAWFWTL